MKCVIWKHRLNILIVKTTTKEIQIAPVVTTPSNKINRTRSDQAIEEIHKLEQIQAKIKLDAKLEEISLRRS